VRRRGSSARSRKRENAAHARSAQGWRAEARCASRHDDVEPSRDSPASSPPRSGALESPERRSVAPVARDERENRGRPWDQEPPPAGWQGRFGSRVFDPLTQPAGSSSCLAWSPTLPRAEAPDTASYRAFSRTAAPHSAVHPVPRAYWKTVGAPRRTGAVPNHRNVPLPLVRGGNARTKSVPARDTTAPSRVMPARRPCPPSFRATRGDSGRARYASGFASPRDFAPGFLRRRLRPVLRSCSTSSTGASSDTRWRSFQPS
jgi:hypothetical protein